MFWYFSTIHLKYWLKLLRIFKTWWSIYQHSILFNFATEALQDFNVYIASNSVKTIAQYFKMLHSYRQNGHCHVKHQSILSGSDELEWFCMWIKSSKEPFLSATSLVTQVCWLFCPFALIILHRRSPTTAKEKFWTLPWALAVLSKLYNWILSLWNLGGVIW